MLLQPRMHFWRQVVFDEVRQQGYEVGAGGLGHVADSVTCVIREGGGPASTCLAEPAAGEGRAAAARVV